MSKEGSGNVSFYSFPKGTNTLAHTIQSECDIYVYKKVYRYTGSPVETLKFTVGWTVKIF